MMNTEKLPLVRGASGDLAEKGLPRKDETRENIWQ
jgi:hypothetical protein